MRHTNLLIATILSVLFLNNYCSAQVGQKWQGGSASYILLSVRNMGKTPYKLSFIVTSETGDSFQADREAKGNEFLTVIFPNDFGLKQLSKESGLRVIPTGKYIWKCIYDGKEIENIGGKFEVAYDEQSGGGKTQIIKSLFKQQLESVSQPISEESSQPIKSNQNRATLKELNRKDVSEQYRESYNMWDFIKVFQKEPVILHGQALGCYALSDFPAFIRLGNKNDLANMERFLSIGKKGQILRAGTSVFVKDVKIIEVDDTPVIGVQIESMKGTRVWTTEGVLVNASIQGD